LSIGLAGGSLYDAVHGGEIAASLFFVLYLQAAFLFSRRDKGVSFGDPRANGVAVLSLASSYLYADAVVRPGAMSTIADLLTLTGGVLVFVCAWKLGRSYGVLPVVRGFEFHGPFGIVRHPMYASYILLDLGWIIAMPSIRNATVFAGALTLYYARARAEEALLSENSEYRDYVNRVRYRFLPGVA
jgi:protein-S-isoprenylcysteine O-methyltransferase Ste14